MIVLLACGHWFTEIRPDGMADPVNGELRACGHPRHYPGRYPATYAVKIEKEDLKNQDPLETRPDLLDGSETDSKASKLGPKASKIGPQASKIT